MRAQPRSHPSLLLLTRLRCAGRAQGRVGTRWGELMRKHRAASERTRGRQTRPSRRASDAGPGPHEEPESPVEEDEDDEDEDGEEDEEEIGDPTDDSAVAPVGANGGTHAAHAPKTSASGPSGAGSSGLRSFLGRKLGWRGAEAGGGQAQHGHSGHHHHHHHHAAAAAAALTGDRHAKEYVEADSPLPSDAADGWASDLGTLSDVLTRFGNVLDELEQARSIFHASLDATFVHVRGDPAAEPRKPPLTPPALPQPIERFVAEETSQALAMRKDAQRKRDEYLLAANRFASLKRTADVSTQVERVRPRCRWPGPARTAPSPPLPPCAASGDAAGAGALRDGAVRPRAPAQSPGGGEANPPHGVRLRRGLLLLQCDAPRRGLGTSETPPPPSDARDPPQPTSTSATR